MPCKKVSHDGWKETALLRPSQPYVGKHTNGIGYTCVSKPLNALLAPIIQKWKEHNFTINQPWPGALCKISNRVKRIVERVVQEPTTTQILYLEIAVKVLFFFLFLFFLLSNVFNLHGLYTHIQYLFSSALQSAAGFCWFICALKPPWDDYMSYMWTKEPVTWHDQESEPRQMFLVGILYVMMCEAVELQWVFWR